MGLSTTWIVTRTDKASMLKALRLVETGEYEDSTLAPTAVAELPDGWVVVHYSRMGQIDHDGIAAAFPRGEVLWGTSSETVMWSGAYGVQDGHQVWSVEHDPDKDLRGVSTTGSPPEPFRTVLDDFVRQQEEEGDDQVDFIFEVPMALTTALCGYDPTRQVGGVPFRVAEPMQSGAAGERQAAAIALTKGLASLIEGRLIPAAQELGFRTADQMPDSPYRFDSPHTLVRFRDGLSEALTFFTRRDDGVARIGLDFFVRRGLEPRSGSLGVAIVPLPKQTLKEFFIGRKPEPAELTLERCAREAQDLLQAVDQHLKSGTPHPHIRPASYSDEVKG